MRGASVLVIWVALGCGGKPVPASPPPAPAPDAGIESDVQLVTSVVVIEACPEAKRIDPRQATREIDELVGPCKKVPGGAAHFSATLLPGGAVELASPEGNPEDGVVPTCVIQQQKQVRHKLRLAKPCKFDVKLEQRTADPS